MLLFYGCHENRGVQRPAASGQIDIAAVDRGLQPGKMASAMALYQSLEIDTLPDPLDTEYQNSPGASLASAPAMDICSSVPPVMSSATTATYALHAS